MTNRLFRKMCVLLGVCILAACDVPTIEIEPPPPLMHASSATARPSLTSRPSLTPTATPVPTSTATLTPTYGPSPTATLSATPRAGAPVITVKANTNCRTGPGRAYRIVGALLVGEEVEILAGEPAGHFWTIENPDHAGETCWLTGQYAVVKGDTLRLPVNTPPATLTPDPASTVGNVFKVQAGGASLVEKIYDRPDTGTGVLGFIRDGELVTLLPEPLSSRGHPYLRADEFTYIETSEGLRGWVRDYSGGRGGYPVLVSPENWRSPHERNVG